MSASTVATMGALSYEFPDLLPLLQEHLEDNEGEMLPHLYLADVMRWLAKRATVREDLCRAILRWLEDAYATGNEEIRGLLTVSGVELIPDPGEPGSELRTLLGPRLRSIDPWPT